MCGVSLLLKSWKWCVFSSPSSYSTCLPLHSLKYPFFSSTAVSSAWHIQSGSVCSYQWDIFSLAGSPFYLTVDQFRTTGHSMQNPVEENVCSRSTHSLSPNLWWIWPQMCSSYWFQSLFYGTYKWKGHRKSYYPASFWLEECVLPLDQVYLTQAHISQCLHCKLYPDLLHHLPQNLPRLHLGHR